MKEGLTAESNRIRDAGVDVLHLAQTSVLIKVGDIVLEKLRQHPVYALCRGLGALGFGSVYLYGAADYFDELDEVMKESNFIQQPGVWLMEEQTYAVPETDVIIDMTNDVASESFCNQLSLAWSCTCIHLMWGRTWVLMSPSVITATQLGEISKLSEVGQDILPPISRIAAGLALQEILMFAGNVEFAAPLEDMVIYNAAAEDRATGSVKTPYMADTVENAFLEVVGAGGIGVHLLESLVPMLGRGCEIRIFDPDNVGVENIPLQTPYTVSDVGQSKAIVVTEKLKRINPNLKIQPMVIKYQNRPQDLFRPSVRIVCADNWAVRYFANHLSINDGIPLVEAGSSPLAAQQRTYYPGMTSCLEHRINNLAKKVAEERKPVGCSANRTLPGTNMVIGGILASEVLKALEPSYFGFPSRGTIHYDARVPHRFGIMDVKPPCEHETPVGANDLTPKNCASCNWSTGMIKP
jgi:molybdopterin/thiamine biosynthesis adenylyltransferase